MHEVQYHIQEDCNRAKSERPIDSSLEIVEDQEADPWPDLWECKHRDESFLKSWLGFGTDFRYQNDYKLQHSTCNKWKRPNNDFHTNISYQLVPINTLSACFAITYALLTRRDALCAVKRWCVRVAWWTAGQACMIEKDRESVASIALSTLWFQQIVALSTRVLTEKVYYQFLS
jgi:hypothetical protein